MRARRILGLVAGISLLALAPHARAEGGNGSGGGTGGGSGGGTGAGVGAATSNLGQVSPVYAPLALGILDGMGPLGPDQLSQVLGDHYGREIIRRADEPGSKRAGTNEHWMVNSYYQSKEDMQKTGGAIFFAIGTHPGSRGAKRNTSLDFYVMRMSKTGIEVLKSAPLNEFVEKYAGEGNDLRYDGLFPRFEHLATEVVDDQTTRVVGAFMLDIRRNVTGAPENGTQKPMEVTNRTHLFAAAVPIELKTTGGGSITASFTPPAREAFVQLDLAQNVANDGAPAVSPYIHKLPDGGVRRALTWYYDGGENQRAYYTYMQYKAGVLTAGPQTMLSVGRVPIGRFAMGYVRDALGRVIDLSCWGEANNRPPRSTYCATVSHENGIGYRTEVFAGSGQRGQLTAGFNSPSITSPDRDKFLGLADDQFAAMSMAQSPVVYINATDMMGKNTNRKGINTPMMKRIALTVGDAFRADEIRVEGTNAFQENWLPTHAHANALSGDQIGFWGGAMASNTPGRLLTARLEGTTLKFEEAFRINPHTDMGWESMMYGENPGNQGRNFIRDAVMIENPWYGEAGAFMAAARRIAVNVVTGTFAGRTIKGVPQVVAVPVDFDKQTVSVGAPTLQGETVEPAPTNAEPAPVTTPVDSSGCGCKTAGYSAPASSGNLALLGLAAGALVFARRRRK